MEISKNSEVVIKAYASEIGREPKVIAYAVGIEYEGNQGPMFFDAEEAIAYAKANDFDYVEEVLIF